MCVYVCVFCNAHNCEFIDCVCEDESETEEMAQFSEEAASLKKQLADCTSTRAEVDNLLVILSSVFV